MRHVAVSEFKATCLSLLEDVRSSGEAIVVTRRGVPIARIEPADEPTRSRRRLGGLRHMATITGDLVEPISSPDEWDAYQ